MVVKNDLPSNLLGQMLYFKFQYLQCLCGGGLEDLSMLAVDTFTPAGAGSSGGNTGGGSGGGGGGGGGGSYGGSGGGGWSGGGLVRSDRGAVLEAALALDLARSRPGPMLSDDFGSVTGLLLSIIDLGWDGNNPHPIAAQFPPATRRSILGMSTTFPTIAENFGSVVDPVVDVLNLGPFLDRTA